LVYAVAVTHAHTPHHVYVCGCTVRLPHTHTVTVTHTLRLPHAVGWLHVTVTFWFGWLHTLPHVWVTFVTTFTLRWVGLRLRLGLPRYVTRFLRLLRLRLRYHSRAAHTHTRWFGLRILVTPRLHCTTVTTAAHTRWFHTRLHTVGSVLGYATLAVVAVAFTLTRYFDILHLHSPVTGHRHVRDACTRILPRGTPFAIACDTRASPFTRLPVTNLAYGVAAFA